MHQVSVNIPETWTVIGYYSLKKKSQKAKCFAENVFNFDPIKRINILPGLYIVP